MCRKTLVITIFCVSAGMCFSGEQTEAVPWAKSAKTYGGATVEKVIGIDKGFSFRCDIKEWPAVIAEDITVRIDGVGPPLIVSSGAMPNKFFELQTAKFMERTFAKVRSVRLENIKRGRTFSIVADVIVDSNSMADLLIGAGLARRSVADGQARIGAQHPLSAGRDGSISVARQSAGAEDGTQTEVSSEVYYVASKSSKVYHRPGCRYAKIISAENLVRFNSNAEAEQTGRRPCKTCNP